MLVGVSIHLEILWKTKKKKRKKKLLPSKAFGIWISVSLVVKGLFFPFGSCISCMIRQFTVPPSRSKNITSGTPKTWELQLQLLILACSIIKVQEHYIWHTWELQLQLLILAWKVDWSQNVKVTFANHIHLILQKLGIKWKRSSFGPIPWKERIAILVPNIWDISAFSL